MFCYYVHVVNNFSEEKKRLFQEIQFKRLKNFIKPRGKLFCITAALCSKRKEETTTTKNHNIRN